jgi:hypothetical protein
MSGQWELVGRKNRRGKNGNRGNKGKKQQNEAKKALVSHETREVEELPEELPEAVPKVCVAPEVCEVKEAPKTLYDCILIVVAYYITVLNLHQRPLNYGKQVIQSWYYLPKDNNVYQLLSFTDNDSKEVLHHNYCNLCGDDVVMPYFETYFEKFFIFLKNWVSFGRNPQFRCKPRDDVLVRSRTGLLYPQITFVSHNEDGYNIYTIRGTHCLPIQPTSQHTVYPDYPVEEMELYNTHVVLKDLYEQQKKLTIDLHSFLVETFSISRSEYDTVMRKGTKKQVYDGLHRDLGIYLCFVLPTRIFPEIANIILAYCPPIELHQKKCIMNPGAHYSHYIDETRYGMYIGSDIPHSFFISNRVPHV